MTEILDVDPILVNISWRDNIHLELTLEVNQRLDGSFLNTPSRPDTIQVDEEQAADYVSRIEKVYGREAFASEVPESQTGRPDGTAADGAMRFLLVDGARMYAVPATQQSDGSYLISINITTFRNRQEIPDGKWAIFPLFGETIGPPARFDLSKHPQLADYSRVFMYANNTESYTVTFALTENEVRPEIRVRTFRFSRIGLITRTEHLKRRTRSKGLTFRKWILHGIYKLAQRTRPKDKPTILFASEQRDSLQGNLKAVYDRMMERGLDKQFHITRHFWIAKARDMKTRFVQTIRIARADYLVIDDYFPGLEALKLDKSTTVIQAWHAGVGFKSVGYARFGNAGSPPRENAHRKYTWAIAGSKNLIPIYADVFGIEPSAIVPTGLPRIDDFLSEEGRTKAIETFNKRHPEVAGRKLVLFAPTYRGRGLRDAYYDYGRIDFAGLYEYCGDDTVIGFRMHHFITRPMEIPPEYAERFIDLTHYPDGLGLLHSTDVLITDYSSIIYEYALLDRPMLFYAYDRDSYAATRGFQRGYDEAAPGKVCLTFDELLKALRSEDFEQEKVTRFRERNFDAIDTGSSDRFIDWFFLGKMPKEF